MKERADANKAESENKATPRQTREPIDVQDDGCKRHVPDGRVNCPRTLERDSTDDRRICYNERREQVKAKAGERPDASTQHWCAARSQD